MANCFLGLWSGKSDGTEVVVGSPEETTKKSRWEVMGQEETVELERERSCYSQGHLFISVCLIIVAECKNTQSLCRLATVLVGAV